LVGDPFAAACGRARLLYTGTVSLLHFLESAHDVDGGACRSDTTALCVRLADEAHAARDALTAALAVAADAIASHTDVSAPELAPHLGAAQEAVGALLAAAAVVGADRAASSPAGEALGHLCFAVADALRQLKCLLCDLDAAHGEATVAAVEALKSPSKPATRDAKPDAGSPPSGLVARATRRLSVIPG
jgi:hypothetical protein